MDELWGLYIIDCFVNFYNKKLERFNFLFWNLGLENVDCFCQNWSDENNWFVLFVILIIKIIKYFVSCKVKGIFIVLKWSFLFFWIFIFGKNLSYCGYV